MQHCKYCPECGKEMEWHGFYYYCPDCNISQLPYSVKIVSGIVIVAVFLISMF